MPRRYPERPIVGIGAVVWRDDKVLLVKRGKPPREGSWSLPGGAQKLGETVNEAAIREVCEETELEITIIGLIDVVDSIHRDANGKIEFHYTLVDVAAISDTGEAEAHDDAADVGWFSRQDLAKLDIWQETIRVVDQAYAIMHNYRSRNA